MNTALLIILAFLGSMLGSIIAREYNKKSQDTDKKQQTMKNPYDLKEKRNWSGIIFLIMGFLMIGTMLYVPKHWPAIKKEATKTKQSITRMIHKDDAFSQAKEASEELARSSEELDNAIDELGQEMNGLKSDLEESFRRKMRDKSTIDEDPCPDCIGPGEPTGTSYADTVGDSGVPINTHVDKIEKVAGIGGPGIYGQAPKIKNGAGFDLSTPAKPSN